MTEQTRTTPDATLEQRLHGSLSELVPCISFEKANNEGAPVGYDEGQVLGLIDQLMSDEPALSAARSVRHSAPTP